MVEGSGRATPKKAGVVWTFVKWVPRIQCYKLRSRFALSAGNKRHTLQTGTMTGHVPPSTSIAMPPVRMCGSYRSRPGWSPSGVIREGL